MCNPYCQLQQNIFSLSSAKVYLPQPFRLLQKLHEICSAFYAFYLFSELFSLWFDKELFSFAHRSFSKATISRFCFLSRYTYFNNQWKASACILVFSTVFLRRKVAHKKNILVFRTLPKEILHKFHRHSGWQKEILHHLEFGFICLIMQMFKIANSFFSSSTFHKYYSCWPGFEKTWQHAL